MTGASSKLCHKAPGIKQKMREKIYPNFEKGKNQRAEMTVIAATNRNFIVLGGGISFTIAGQRYCMLRKAFIYHKNDTGYHADQL